MSPTEPEDPNDSLHRLREDVDEFLRLMTEAHYVAARIEGDARAVQQHADGVLEPPPSQPEVRADGEA